MCRAHRQATDNQGQQGHGGVHRYVSTVEALNTAHPTDCRRPWDNREQPQWYTQILEERPTGQSQNFEKCHG